VTVGTHWHPVDGSPWREHLCGIFSFKCPYCRFRNGHPQSHEHGVELMDGFGILGHRAAHCWKRSPLSDRGYYIAGAYESRPGVAIERDTPKCRLKFYIAAEIQRQVASAILNLKAVAQ